MTNQLLHVIAEILAKLLQYVSTLRLSGLEQIDLLYTYLEQGLYSHFAPLIIHRPKEEVKGLFLMQFASSREYTNLKLYSSISLKKKDFFSSGMRARICSFPSPCVTGTYLEHPEL